MLFSQRKGYKKVKDVIQIEYVDEETRNGLWNGLSLYYWNKVQFDFISENNSKDIYGLFIRIWHSYFKFPLDTLGNQWPSIKNDIRKYFFECDWNEVYDFIEFVANNYKGSNFNTTNEDFINFCNGILEREICGYRFVNGKIAEITTSTEIAEIEQAINSSVKAVNEHLNRALELMSDRKNPDYRNSIKESISAVETISKIITGDPKATLGEALKKIENKISIHSALKNGFINIYGYTNDKSGIRHSLLEESNLKFEDAKFMLVSCSAFINYLKSKSAEAGIKI